MRPVSISDLELVDTLSGVVERFGVEGASVRRFSDASGLQRASLYHRFPGGKDEIVQAVAARAASRFDVILAPAFDENVEPSERARMVADRLSEYYDAGHRPCLVAALSLGTDAERQMAENCLAVWTGALACIARAAGHPDDVARSIAADSVAIIEGAVVVAAATGNTDSFRRVIETLPERLVGRG